MTYALVFGLGVVLGVGATLLVMLLRRREAKAVAKELVAQAEVEKMKDLEVLLDRIRESFGSLSMDALSRNSDEFLKLAKETLSTQTKAGEKDLEGKKALIDGTLQGLKTDLEKVEKLVSELERDRVQKFGELSTQLRSAVEETNKLQQTSEQLRSVLADRTARGEWGERMAEDVLRLAGFVRGVNYLKGKALDTARSKPDYTFLLPQDLKVNMDVKFPLDNYRRYLQTEAKSDKETFLRAFLGDVRNRVKEVTTRDYINPAERTLDYVIVFIPNEHVYGFINENDPTLMDDALKSKVVLSSPITLYAILVVIRQAVDNFTLEKTAGEILSHMGAFAKQWEMFVKSMTSMGKRIDDAQKEYASLLTTRRNQLERRLQKIEELRVSRGIPAAEADSLVAVEDLSTTGNPE